MLLEIDNLSKYFGGLRAVSGVNLSVEEGGVYGIIGPNGAGKTTLFNLVSGYLRPSEGRITFRGRRVDRLEAHRRVKLGIARTFQIVRPFGDLNVLENVLVGWGHRYYDTGKVFFGRYLSSRDAGMEILSFVGLEDKWHLLAGALPIGMQRRLEIARTIALSPSLLLLDEPAAGLTENEIGDLKDLVRRIVAQEVTVILVEHRMSFVMDICERVTVLDHGTVIAEGNPVDVTDDPRVIEAYLGTPLEKKEGEDDAAG